MSAARYAELLSDQRAFSEEELALFQRSARASYEDFRNKAALSRRLAEEDLEEKAQVLPPTSAVLDAARYGDGENHRQTPAPRWCESLRCCVGTLA